MPAPQPAGGVSLTAPRLASLGLLSRSSEYQARTGAIGRLAKWQCTHSIGSAAANGKASFSCASAQHLSRLQKSYPMAEKCPPSIDLA
jgi:hypothetical protein